MNSVEESKTQPRTLCQTLKNLGTSSKLKSSSKNVGLGLKIDNEICFDKSKVDEKLIIYFQPLPHLCSTSSPTGSGKWVRSRETILQ